MVERALAQLRTDAERWVAELGDPDAVTIAQIEEIVEQVKLRIGIVLTQELPDEGEEARPNGFACPHHQGVARSHSCAP
ncbi:MAG: hypothetical protein FJX77_05205 [Armatimonadetes bacterium]|nr:hypothetical protein [Armatimonadota bacterium]